MGCCVGKARNDDDDDKLDFRGGNVHIITTREAWDEKIAESIRDGRTVVANFSAFWCGPCRVIAPFYVEMSKTYAHLMFLVVDVDELTEFSASWDLRATPTFFFIRNGKQFDKVVGALKPELEKKLPVIAKSSRRPAAEV